MSEYKLEIKQIVDYARCRIYRQFIQTLMSEKNVRVGGTSGLYYYTVLCSYANFRTSYKKFDGISYTVRPGEWICKVSELTDWFRTRFRHQAISILMELQDKHYITFSLIGRGKLVRYSINGWGKHNRILDYDAPCQKNTGFFFLPIAIANELVGMGKCSEMDVLLDMWVNTVYNDTQVQGSDRGPVVYFRNNTGNPLIGYSELAERWGVSKATAGRYLKKLSDLKLIKTVSFPGTHGSVIYICRYLSTMFEISDVIVDKNELAMALNIRLEESEINTEDCDQLSEISVSKNIFGVSKSHIAFIVQKVAKILTAQGFACCSCSKIRYKLLQLSEDCKKVYIVSNKTKKDDPMQFILAVSCNENAETFRFEIKLTKGGTYEKD